MAPVRILDLPSNCLSMIFKYLDLKSQCSFYLTCRRFKWTYLAVHKRSFQYFNWWSEGLNTWTHTDIDTFFKLNGSRIKMMTVFGVFDEFPTKEVYFLNTCNYLKNLQRLIICMDCKQTEIIAEICKHLKKLVDLTIDSNNHSNYEPLLELNYLKCLDIECFVDPEDRFFAKLAELRPYALKSLRIGSDITVEIGWHIGFLYGIEMLNICNPDRHFVNCVVMRLGRLRCVNFSDAQQLEENDFKHVLSHLKYLSILHVCACTVLTDDFVFYVLEFLQRETKKKHYRRLPFALELLFTSISDDLNEIEPLISSLSLMTLNAEVN